MEPCHLNGSMHVHAWDFWLARASVILIVGLQLSIINNLGFGPRWFAPALELSLLIPLSIATAWTQASSRAAMIDEHRRRVLRHRRFIRMAAALLTAIITLLNFAALIELVRDLLHASAKMTAGQTLLLDALNVWTTNIIVFAMWFWNIDRGGPATRGLSGEGVSDFLFPQNLPGSPQAQDWSPGFVDYLYLSFTNATAFSPTDTPPLSARAKLLMMFEAAISLLTIALVAARAVNILA